MRTLPYHGTILRGLGRSTAQSATTLAAPAIPIAQNAPAYLRQPLQPPQPLDQAGGKNTSNAGTEPE